MSETSKFNLDYFRQVCAVGEVALQRFEEEKFEPQKYQNEFLFKIIEDNINTEYGQKYHFDCIKTIEDFKRNVPISEYSDYESYINRMIDGKEDHLITSYPIVHYAITSGTTGRLKRIPMSLSCCVFSSTYVGNVMFAYLQREIQRQNKRPGPVCMLFDISLRYLDNNVTTGVASATIPYNFMDKLEGLVSSPIELQCPKKPIEDAIFLKALFALAEKNLVCIDATFSSVVFELLKTIEDRWSELVESIKTGLLPADLSISAELRASLEDNLHANLARAEELSTEFSIGFDETIVSRIWPNFALFYCIGGGFTSEYTKKLKRYAKDIPMHMSLYASSETILGLATNINEAEYALFPNGVFFEFLPIDETDYSKTLLLSELEDGMDYEVIVTNQSGLYRYRTLDVIHVEKHYEALPMCHVLYRLNQMIDLVGEKMTTYHFDNAIRSLSEKIGYPIYEYSVYADYSTTPAHYRVLVEPETYLGEGHKEKLDDIFDRILKDVNCYYELYRNAHHLAKAHVLLVAPGTHDNYKKTRIKSGVSENQIKPIRIIIDSQK